MPSQKPRRQGGVFIGLQRAAFSDEADFVLCFAPVEALRLIWTLAFASLDIFDQAIFLVAF